MVFLLPVLPCGSGACQAAVQMCGHSVKQKLPTPAAPFWSRRNVSKWVRHNKLEKWEAVQEGSCMAVIGSHSNEYLKRLNGGLSRPMQLLMRYWGQFQNADTAVKHGDCVKQWQCIEFSFKARQIEIGSRLM
eukprot:1153953-Pelagomonas_calceolata.AAC.1